MRRGVEVCGSVSKSQLRVTPPQIAIGEDGAHLEIDVCELGFLRLEFRQYIWDRIPESEQWQSTSDFMEYLALDVVELQLLGFIANEETEADWSLDMFFSSCGGMAEVSAQLAAHWARIWLLNQASKIKESLAPFGFAPETRCTYIETADIESPPTRFPSRMQPCPRFVPIADSSYASYRSSRGNADNDSRFDLNSALVERIEDTQDLLAELEHHYGAALAEGKCLCQLCAPEIDSSGVRCHRT